MKKMFIIITLALLVAISLGLARISGTGDEDKAEVNNQVNVQASEIKTVSIEVNYLKFNSLDSLENGVELIVLASTDEELESRTPVLKYIDSSPKPGSISGQTMTEF